MIKTHKPRGHFWTCASQFQQLKEYRNIGYEDLGFVDDLPIAKRRKIEKLADDFLNGQELIIHSARPTITTLRKIIEWNQRSMTGSKYSLSAVDCTTGVLPIWADVEDDWEILHNTPPPRQPDVLPECVSAVIEAVNPEQDQKQGAAIRTRRPDRAASESVAPPRLLDNVPQKGDETECLGTSPAFTLGLQNSHDQKTGGLSRSSDESVTLDNEDNVKCDVKRDQSLGAEVAARVPHSLMSAQSNRSFGLPRRDFDPAHLDSAASLAGIASSSDTMGTRDRTQTGVTGALHQEMRSGHSNSNDLPAANHTNPAAMPPKSLANAACEAMPIEPLATQARSQSVSQGDSPTRLLRKQGIRAAPRKVWAVMNENDSESPREREATHEEVHDTVSSNISAIRKSLRESAQKASRSNNRKGTRSASKAVVQNARQPKRRRSKPTELQNDPRQTSALPVEQQRRMSLFRVQREDKSYPLLQTTDDGDTPFTYRKRQTTRGIADGVEAIIIARGRDQRGKITPPSPGDAQAMPDKQLAAHTPVLETSSSHGVPLVSAPSMALVDEHLNSVLPNTASSKGRSSAVRKAIKDQMRLSGGEFSCAPGDLTSSQADDTVAVGSRDEINEQASGSVPFATQELLSRAQRDLFASPEKAGLVFDRNTDTTPEIREGSARDEPSTTTRHPSHELSISQRLGTQPLTWSPWSTLKKPEAPRSITGTDGEGRDQRLSRLRFSTSMVASPLDPAEQLADSAHRFSSLRMSASALGSPMRSGRISYPVCKPWSSAESSAQTPSIQLAREDKDIDHAIDMLTEDVFGSKDVVLSQVSY